MDPALGPGDSAAPVREPGLDAKVAFLADARHHLPRTKSVTVVETHQSFVFLTETRAYKLKKASRLDRGDLSKLAVRESQCREEVRLNRRLTDGVYDGVVPLSLTPSGRLVLGGPGGPIDWLVSMRRLPAALMLDRMIAAASVDLERLRSCVSMLAAFYRAQPPEPITGEAFRQSLARRILENRTALARPELRITASVLDDIQAGQLRLLAALGAEIDQRVREGRIVEGHGDLRPEHVCLEPRPQVIDCLEFSRELRIVDAAEELGFLALECERLGAPDVGRAVLDAYREASPDDAPARLVDFYQAVHAGVRAKLAAWHLDEPGSAGPGHWIDRARTYAALARAHAGAALRLTPA